MAFYHVGGCDCPEGCCDCGVDSIVKDLKDTIKIRAEEITFKAKYKDPTDGRLRVIKPFLLCETQSSRFIEVFVKPTVKQAISMIEQLHVEFKDSERYKPSILKASIWVIINAFPNRDQRKIHVYFEKKFEKVHTTTNWI